MDKTLNFSNYFNVSHELIDAYGALDISLINDLPLFIDPFLLFSSEKLEYKKIHKSIIQYILFLKELASNKKFSQCKPLLLFPEVKQNWLGFSENGNSGRGMGSDFARGLFDGLRTVFADFGTESILESPHMEKFSLIRPNIGKDKISDFTTNFAKEYLLDYTQEFAQKNIDNARLKTINVDRVYFDFEYKRWMPKTFKLPFFNGDYVLLTPKDMLTTDDTFINRSDMIASAHEFAPSIGNEALRFSFSNFVAETIRNDELKKSQKNKAIADFIALHPEIINYYIKFKEQRKEKAAVLSGTQVECVDQFFVDAAGVLSAALSTLPFYETRPTSFKKAKERVCYLKHVIEDCDCYKLLWKNNKEPSRESDVQLLFRLVWHGADFDLNREVNNGRGPVDYVVSKGAADKTVVEFKLAKNTKLKQSLENQVEIYKRANNTNSSITVIVFYTEAEQKRVEKILNELGLAGNDHIVQIDARKDNKPSGSNAKTVL